MEEDTAPKWLLEEDALIVIKNLLRFCALLPGKTKREILQRKITVNVILILMIFTVIGAFIEAYNTRSNFMGFIQCGTVCITLVKCLFKIWYTRFKEKDLRYLLDTLPRNFYVKDNVHQEKILSTIRAKKKTAWILSVPYTSIFIFTIFLIALDKMSSLTYRPPEGTIIVNGTSNASLFIRTLPLRIWLPLDEQKSPYYEIGYLYQLTIFTYQIYSTCVIDACIAVLVMYASVQFELLASTIEHAKQNVKELLEENAADGRQVLSGEVTDDEEPNIKDSKWRSEMDNYLKLCVKRHQALLEYIRRLNIISSPIELLQALTSSILICTLGFTAITSGNTAILPKVILYTACAFLQIGLPCYCATQLQTQSMAVAEAAYNCAWYEEPVSFQKSISLILMRAQKPELIFVGPFGTMSLELFAGVAQSAYSYLTLLRQVYE
ncbi:Odorant receptor 59 [Blattella germanica]|nr:Odorant receptor 59 [Blattella germanica]